MRVREEFFIIACIHKVKDNIQNEKDSGILWILSHTVHQWPWLLLALTGAISNAALASVVPIYIGKAFNEILLPEPSLQIIGRFALIIGISQIIRGILQFGRNYGFEIVAQNLEKYVRQELYVNLLGKSMTFHNLQSVGDPRSCQRCVVPLLPPARQIDLGLPRGRRGR